MVIEYFLFQDLNHGKVYQHLYMCKKCQFLEFLQKILKDIFISPSLFLICKQIFISFSYLYMQLLDFLSYTYPLALGQLVIFDIIITTILQSERYASARENHPTREDVTRWRERKMRDHRRSLLPVRNLCSKRLVICVEHALQTPPKSWRQTRD